MRSSLFSKLSKEQWALAAILAFSTVARLLYLNAYRSDPFSTHLLHDAGRYHDWAVALASGQVWEHGAFYQAPFYPYLVAAVYRLSAPEPLVVYGLQLVLGVLTIFLVFAVARRAYGEPAGLAAAALATFYAPLVFFENKLLPASLAVFLSVLLLERIQSADSARRDYAWLVPGVLLGLAALTNPGLLLMGLLGTGWLLLDRSRPLGQRSLRVAFLVLGAGILILPVTIRNYRASGEWVLISTNGGITCYQGNNPNAVGVFSTPPGFSGRIEGQREESRKLAEDETGSSMGDAAVSSFFLGKALRYLGQDPMHSLGLVARKLLLGLANEEQALEYNQRLDFNAFRWLFPLPFAVILGLAMARTVVRRDQDLLERAETPLLLLVQTELVVLLAFYVSGRYRLPVTPALAAIAGFGLISLWRSLVNKRPRALTMSGIAVLTTILSLAYVPLTRGPLLEQQLAMGHIDRAAALWAVGRHADAVEALRRSLELDPAFSERHLDLAQALHRLGRIEEAEAAAREAIRRDPDSMEAWFFFGVLCIEQRRLEEAASVFTDLLRRDPTSENSANNLLGVLIQLDRMDDAVALWGELRQRGLSVEPTLESQLRSASSSGE